MTPGPRTHRLLAAPNPIDKNDSQRDDKPAQHKDAEQQQSALVGQREKGHHADHCMPLGIRRHRRASLRVALATGLPVEMQDKIRELLSVVSEDRGKGHAKALLWQVTAEADRAGMVLMLKPEPFADGLTLDQLVKFYERFGFVKIQESPCLMARQPEIPPTLRFDPRVRAFRRVEDFEGAH